MRDERDDIRSKRFELKEELDLHLTLREHTLFANWHELMEAQLQTRRDVYEMQAPEKGMDSLVEQQFMRGEMAGIRLAMEMFDSGFRVLQEGIATCDDALMDMVDEEGAE